MPRQKKLSAIDCGAVGGENHSIGYIYGMANRRKQINLLLTARGGAAAMTA